MGKDFGKRWEEMTLEERIEVVLDAWEEVFKNLGLEYDRERIRKIITPIVEEDMRKRMKERC